MNGGHTRSLNVKTWNQCKGKPPPSYLHACTVRSNSANSFDKQGWKEVWDLNGGILLSIPESSETGNWEKLESLGKFMIWEICDLGKDYHWLWFYPIHQSDHTSYLSRTPRIYSCKFFLAGVNFYRFNAKNWNFRQILRKKVAFFTDLTRKIGVFYRFNAKNWRFLQN